MRFIFLTLLIFILLGYAQTDKISSSKICLGFLPDTPDCKTVRILLCKGGSEKEIYRIEYDCEDVGVLYFDKAGNFLAHCDYLGEYPDPAQEKFCEDMQKYICDSDNDLKEKLCR